MSRLNSQDVTVIVTAGGGRQAALPQTGSSNCSVGELVTAVDRSWAGCTLHTLRSRISRFPTAVLAHCAVQCGTGHGDGREVSSCDIINPAADLPTGHCTALWEEAVQTNVGCRTVEISG